MYLTESEVRQLDLLKKKSPVERFLMMSELIVAQVEAMKSGLKYRNPEMTDKELEQCLKDRVKKIYSMKL